MAISNDWYIDYYNKLICHSTTSIDYDTETNGGFTAGMTIGDTSVTPTKQAIIVKVLDNGTDGTLDLVYVKGTFANNDTLFVVGGTQRGLVNGTPTTKTTTYTTRALYSFIQDTFDEVTQLDDTVPMSAQTPTEFTLINDWFIDDVSVKFLTGGALTISAATDADDAVRVISFGGTYTSAVVTDIGLPVVEGTNSGTLLHYDNTTKKWFVRVDLAADAFAAAASTAVTGGTGTGTSLGTATTGLALYTNIYTLGTIAIDPKPETYIFQNSSAISPWWSRGDSLAHIDVLIKVKESGVNIGDGTITCFVRHYGDLFDHFPIDISSGGRQAVPLASASDLNNNATGEGYLLFDGQTGAFAVGLIVTGGTSGATAEILAQTDWGASGVLTLGHIKGTFSDNEALTDSGTGVAVVNGTIGYLYVAYSSEAGGGFAVSDTVTGATSGATAVLRGLQDDGTSGKLVLTPSGTTGKYLNYSATENLQVTASTRGVADAAATRSVAGFDDIKIWFVNQNISHGAVTGGPFQAGEAISQAVSGATGIFLDTTAGLMTIGNNNSGTFVTGQVITGATSGATTTTSSAVAADYQLDKAFTQGSSNPYSVIIDCAGRTMAQVYEWLKYVTRESANSTAQINYVTMYPLNNSLVVAHDGEEYIAARYLPDTVFTPVKASPFGTFAGGKFFGARGVWVYDMANADIQAFQLIDSNGSTQTPPNFQNITITNLVSGDRVMVTRTSSGTTVNKAVFTSNAANTAGDATFEVNETIPSDTPDSGVIRVVDTSDTSLSRETRYTYTGWTNTAQSQFTGISPVLDRTYTTGSDTAYVPYIDTTASSDTAQVTVIYSTDRTVVARIRRYNSTVDSILPFQTTGTFSSTGYSSVTIRTIDTIVT